MKKQTGFGVYLPGWEYIPDGEPHVFGDRVFLFGSHDRFNGNSFCLNDYVCWSAPLSDLTDWRCEGVIYRRTQDPDNRDGRLAMWAPDVAQGPDGRYYLYYCLANYCKTGVAVCDTPAGQYEFLGWVKDAAGNAVGTRKGDFLPFDPGIFVDNDGSVHLCSGQAPMGMQTDRELNALQRFVAGLISKKSDAIKNYAWHMELQPDMLTLKTEPVPIVPNVRNSAGTGFETHEFFEGSSLRKFGGKYYFIYSSVRSHELCYAVSDRPDGGFTYGGTIISNADIGLGKDLITSYNGKPSRIAKNYSGNTHGSIIKLGGDYYVFYHRQTNRNMYSRQACVEKTFMAPDGSFPQREMTCCGFYGDTLPGKGGYEARIACNLWSKEGCVVSAHKAVQNKKHPAFTQAEPDGMSGTQYIENLRDGATAGYKYFDLTGTTGISITVRGPGKGAFVLRDGEEGRTLCSVPVMPSKKWQSFSAPLTGGNAHSGLFFTYEGNKFKDFLSFELC